MTRPKTFPAASSKSFMQYTTLYFSSQSFKGALVNGSSGIEILKHLNTFYKPNGDQPALGRNAYETSLTAFVFMSFGVFLLKQIETVGEEENNDVLGRNQRGNPNSSPGESSDLSLLFDPPVMNWTVFINSTKLGQNGTQEHQWIVDTNGTMSTRYINSLFRGAANLVNAYTKDTDVLECIWSLYCQELDKTSAKDGLYGIAARINRYNNQQISSTAFPLSYFPPPFFPS